MPRKSRAELATPVVAAHEPIPVQPPATLSEAGRAAFVELVASCEPGHFEPSDATLLAQYAEASVLAAKAAVGLQAGDASQLPIWEKATRTMSGLALRLRLGPQSRREKAKVERPLTWSENFRLQQFGKL